jgi:hypothetical protein
MLGEAAAELAAAGGTALVTAMVTDAWESVKDRFARLLGHGDAKEAERVSTRLDESRTLLAVPAGTEMQRTLAEQELAWRIRLGDLLERQPEAEGELRSLIDEVRARTQDQAGRVEQHVTGYDHAQQAIQGHGIQVNTFGGPDDVVTGR